MEPVVRVLVSSLLFAITLAVPLVDGDKRKNRGQNYGQGEW